MLTDTIRSVKDSIIKNEAKVLEGKLVGLPWYHTFPRLGNYIPVIPFGTQIMFTANSGVGKSNSWLGMILFTHYKLKKILLNNTYKVKFVITLLEDTKEMLINRLFCMILYDKYRIRIDVLALNSMRKQVIPKEVKDKLDDIELEIINILEDCEISDSIFNPYGIYKWARNLSIQLGTHHYKEVDFTNESNETVKEKVYSHYQANDPDMQVIMIVDNLNNLTREKEGGILLQERETINKWTRQYGRLQITKHWNWTLINILQQSSESEKPQYNYKGELVIDKCKPSLDGLGGSKECQRDHQLIFGLFAPARYGIEQYPEVEGYNIRVLGDAFRSIILLKSNISECNKEIPLYFDGACSRFDEMPLPNQMNPTIYKAIKERNIKPGFKI